MIASSASASGTLSGRISGVQRARLISHCLRRPRGVGPDSGLISSTRIRTIGVVLSDAEGMVSSMGRTDSGLTISITTAVGIPS